MKQEELYVIEDFVQQMESNVKMLEDHLSLFDLPEDKRKLHEATILLLKTKIEQMKEARTKKELKKVLRVKKLLEDQLDG